MSTAVAEQTKGVQEVKGMSLEQARILWSEYAQQTRNSLGLSFIRGQAIAFVVDLAPEGVKKQKSGQVSAAAACRFLINDYSTPSLEGFAKRCETFYRAHALTGKPEYGIDRWEADQRDAKKAAAAKKADLPVGPTPFDAKPVYTQIAALKTALTSAPQDLKVALGKALVTLAVDCGCLTVEDLVNLAGDIESRKSALTPAEEAAAKRDEETEPMPLTVLSPDETPGVATGENAIPAPGVTPLEEVTSPAMATVDSPVLTDEEKDAYRSKRQNGKKNRK